MWNNETRVDELTKALEDLVEQFEVGGDRYTIGFTAANGEVLDMIVSPSTQEAVDNALRVLYDEERAEDVENGIIVDEDDIEGL